MTVQVCRGGKLTTSSEVDVPALYFTVCSPLYLEDLYQAAPVIHNMVASLPPDEASTNETVVQRENAVRSLFEAAREHLDMHNSYCTESVINIFSAQ